MVIQKLNRKGLECFQFENQSKLKLCRSEDAEQIQFTTNIRYHYPDLLYFHTVNEGKVSAHYRAKQIRKGLLSGVSDIMILKPNGHYSFLAIELKKEIVSKCQVSKEQVTFIEDCKANGGFACVAYGAQAAMFVVKEYLNDNLSYTV